MFDKEVTATVTQFPDAVRILDYLPYDFEEIFRRLKDMWSVVFNGECFSAYLVKLSDFLRIITLIALPILLIVPCLWLIVSSSVFEPNTDHGAYTKQMKRFDDKWLPRIQRATYYLKGLITTFKENNWFFYPGVILWVINLNVFTIAAEVVAYYFYFAMSIDFSNLLSVQFGKLILDVSIMLLSGTFVFWMSVAYALICVIRRHIGFSRLDYHEDENRAFIKKQPLGFMAVGSMGSKKTTFVTDVAISKEIMLRDKAYELIIEQDLKFPNFPWINLEDSITLAMERREIRSLTTARRWIRLRRHYYEANALSIRIWDYPIDKYPTTHDDNLRIQNVWDILENYTQLYFIYVIQSSLLVANYSIRVDNVLEYAGNFPLWNTELFRRTPEEVAAVSRHSHILDNDTLRLGVTMVEENPNRAAFEFGVVVITEIGKERGNQLTNKGQKADDDKCNTINDLFNEWVKLFRHKATVCYYPFVCIICDEQRPESLNADLRELFSIVHIRDVEDVYICMPFYFVESIIHDIVFKLFGDFYKKYRFYRGDTSLFKYILHNLTSVLHLSYIRNLNLFGCSKMKLEVERGTQDGEMQVYIYYLSEKKVHSDRFATDCFVLYFEEAILKAQITLLESPEYDSLEPSGEEYALQNSHLIRKMEKF